MYTGTIKFCRNHGGFGFIARPNEPDVFFHCTQWKDTDLEFSDQLEQLSVQFDLSTDAAGRLQAKNVRRIQ